MHHVELFKREVQLFNCEEGDAVEVIRHALDVGCSFIDTADAYGNGHNEQPVGRAVTNRRSEAFVATKFDIVFDPNETGMDVPTGWGFSLKINGKIAVPGLAQGQTLL